MDSTVTSNNRNNIVNPKSNDSSLSKNTEMSVGVIHYNMESYGENIINVPAWGEHVGLHSIKALDELGIKLFLCSTAFPKKEKTLERVGIDVEQSVDGFVKAIGRNKILPFLGIYQRLVYSYFFFKKLINSFDPDFFLVTGGSAIIPQSMAERTIVYVHYPTDLEISQKYYTSNIMKKLYIKPYLFVSNNLDYIKKATIITNSNYTKNAIKQIWNVESTFHICLIAFLV